jgi:two-component system NtrC family sensor kinase
LAKATGVSVLVVDDEAGISSLLSDLLEADGYRVVTASNGVAALALLEKETFDAVLTDIRMPELDGPGLYREVERRHPALASRIAFMTGNILTEDTADFFAVTGAPCVRKPFVRDDVLRVLQQVMGASSRRALPVA